MMENYRFDERNFHVVEQINVYKVAVDVLDNRTDTETTLLMLLDCTDGDDCRDKVIGICRKYGYSIIQFGDPMIMKVDLNTFAVME